MNIINIRQLLTISILWIVTFTLSGQCYISGKITDISETFIECFEKQLSLFPQEKIHLHTDKPYYLSGERIWFRAHVANAATHIPFPISRYVYVELINPLDSIVTRVKILEDEGAYHGYLLIPDDVPEGDYTMRAYTTFMQSLEEHYFFTKTIRIGDPQSRAIHAETQFTFSLGNRVDATFRFSNVNSNVPLVPKSFKVSVNSGKMMNVNVNDNGTAAINFNLPAASRERTILLEVVASNNPYRKFIRIPTPDDDFDVTFYPEGGFLLQGVLCKIAFKAMKSNGQATHISGVVYDQSGAEIQTFESQHLGMGNILLHAEKGKSYYAVCENEKGQSKRFDLPAAVDHGYALSINHVKDKIHVSVLKPDLLGLPDPVGLDDLYLLAHTRGIVQHVELWDHEKNALTFQSDQFPSGVLHFVLFDAGMNPLSERLVFDNNQDQAQVTCQPDKDNFDRRSLVKNSVTLTDSDGVPLTGNFSVSVTSDREVVTDSTTNILTQLLLTSDLRGYIENPAFYFQNTLSSDWALDLLMRTQGWRRYNIAELVQGRYSRPTMPLEKGAEISGTVKTVILGQPVEGVEVTVMSMTGEYYDKTKTDKNSRFYLRGCDLPDSTRFIVHATPSRGMTRMELIIDKESFPKKTLSAVPPAEIDKHQFAKYADKAELQYSYDGGIRMYHLSEVTVTAERIPPRESIFYHPDMANRIFSEKEIKRTVAMNLSELLNQLMPSGFSRGKTTLLGISVPLLLVDDVIWDSENIDDISVFDIAQIDILKMPESAVFGTRGDQGAIIIHTKRGEYNDQEIPRFHIKSILPLGYQQPVEFYSPKYDTPVKRDAPTPDLRTTIYWQPVVQTDSQGVASFEFYTADEPTTYTVVFEGLANDGRIICQKKQLYK